MASKKQQSGSEKSFLALPRLRAGHGMQMPVGHEWFKNDQALGQISRNIDVQNSAEKGHSIPDIFSQSIQFEFDLSIENADAVGQWQGLLATLLLAGSGGQLRIRTLTPDALPDSPFARIFRATAKRRAITALTLFELRKRDGDFSAVAFRFEGMPTMLCPAAAIQGPFAIDDPWIVRAEQGYAFTAPYALLDDARYADRRIALRNEMYALSQRMIPSRENRDGLQLTRLRAFFEWLSRADDGISSHPVNAAVRALLYTIDDADIPAPSGIFTDKICLFREGGDYNHLHAAAAETMRIFSGGMPTQWRALLPLRPAYALSALPRLLSGALRLRMVWHNGAVDVELLDERDAVIEDKRYRIQDLVNYTFYRNAPQVAVWPPRALPGWRRYYLMRYDDGNALPLVPEVLGVGRLKNDVTLLSAMPRALSFSLEGEDVGVLLPAYETAHNDKSKEFNVGFDFGTTGTTAYKHDPGAGITTPISFASQGALFLFGRNEGADVALTAQLVSARIAERATHYSLLRRKTEQQMEGGALTHTTIPFLHSAAFNPEVVRDVSDDLKWGSLAADKLRANLFLEQYLMMCLWHVATHGAASVHWRASYPLSMHGRLQDEYVAKIQTIVSGLCTHCYKIPYDAYFCSESEAVGFMMMDNDIQARYLKGQTVNDQTGFFCVDIGGGSTDLSLWQRRRPLMQASLRWAGNAILSDSVTRVNHGQPARENLLEFFLPQSGAEGKRSALAEPLLEGRYDEFRRVWNVLVDEVTDSMKGVHRGNAPLLNYLNIVRINLYLLFYFGGRMVRESLKEGVHVGLDGTPLPVAVLGNGAKMMKLLYNDVEVLQRPLPDGSVEYIAEERRNETRYEEEMARLTRAFVAGCGVEGFAATIIEPFMPKQEAARGLALAPEAFLTQQHAGPPDAERAQGGWPGRSAYVLDEYGSVRQALTDEYRALVMDSFVALRGVFDDDEAFRAFLSSLFSPPDGMDKFSVTAYFENIWAQCLRHNPEPMLPGQPLPPKNTIAGRYVEMLSAMNRMMKTV